MGTVLTRENALKLMAFCATEPLQMSLHAIRSRDFYCQVKFTHKVIGDFKGLLNVVQL